MVSKPVAPPWNDSSKNLVRDLCAGMERHQAVVMRPRGAEPMGAGAIDVGVYPSTGNFAPGLSQQAAVARFLALSGRNYPIWHFFFAPNPRSSSVARLLSKVARRPTVQTVASAPKAGVDMKKVIFGRRVIVLSEKTKQRLLAEGIERQRVVRIPPAVPEVSPEEDPEELRKRLRIPDGHSVVTYPGDLEFSGGATLALDAAVGRTDVTLLMACRKKTADAEAAESHLKRRARELGIAERVRWVGETRSIYALLKLSDLVILPSRDLYAKMDYPLVLLEAMSLGVPVLVATGSAAAELADAGAAVGAAPETAAVQKAVARLVEAPTAARLQGETGRRYVDSHHRIPAMSRAYEAVYDQLTRA